MKEKPRNLTKLGIGEITHLKGGKNYAAVLVDLDNRKPIALLEKRNKEVIAEYLRGLGSGILSQIQEVSIDLWKPYKSDAARSWGASAVLGRQRGLGEAARSWGFPP